VVGKPWRAAAWCSACTIIRAPTWKRRRQAGVRLQIQVLGMASIASDVSVELALATIESISVLGALHASSAVKTALAERIL
jgi:hypothetical protein